jgi:hypothetical protein
MPEGITQEAQEGDVPQGPQVPPEPQTLEEFEARCMADEAYRSDYFSNPHDERFEKFNAMQEAKMTGVEYPQETPAPTGEEPPVAPQGQAEPGTPPAEEDIISLTIPKSALGTYLKGREAPEAVLEALKGKQNADQYIEKLRKERDDYQNQLLSYQQQSQVPAQPAAQAAQLPEADPDLLSDEQFNELDLFDPENQERLGRHLAAQNREIVALRAAASSAVEATSKFTARQQQEAQRQLQQSQTQREFREIEDLQAVAPELRTTRPFTDVDRDVTEFYRRVAESTGMPDDKALTLYFSQTPEGEALRTRLAGGGIAPPEEYDAHQRVMSIRAQKLRDYNLYVKQLSQQLGRELKPSEVPPPPNSTYVDYWGKQQGRTVPQLPPAAPPPSQVPQRPAPQAQPPAAPEVPPGVSVPLIGPENMSEQDMYTLANKPTAQMSQDEARLLLKIYEKDKIPPPADIAKKAGYI